MNRSADNYWKSNCNMLWLWHLIQCHCTPFNVQAIFWLNLGKIGSRREKNIMIPNLISGLLCFLTFDLTLYLHAFFRILKSEKDSLSRIFTVTLFHFNLWNKNFVHLFKINKHPLPGFTQSQNTYGRWSGCQISHKEWIHII